MEITLKAKIKAKETYPVLQQMASHLEHAKRCLFQGFSPKTRSLNDIKREAQINHQITARQFNSLRMEIQGQLDSYRENKQRQLGKLERRLKKKQEQLEKTRNPFKRHHLKRKITSLQSQLQKCQAEIERPSICFGSRKLFHEQFHLEENGYASHSEWKKEWEDSRNSHFFLVGSKDESFGNQSCQFLPGRLQLRLTHRVAKEFGHTTIDIPVEFTYRQEVTQHALVTGQAMSYRFIKEGDSWYVHLTTEYQEVQQVTERKFGALGIDLNPGCLAIAQIGPDGNLVDSWQVDLNLRGRTKDQLEATLGEEIALLVKTAAERKLPIVIEDLDFEKKKEELRSRNLNRMLSNFAYSQFFDLMEAQCYRVGVELILVNPAYTSVIGKAKFSEGFGISSHLAAAMAIARRGLGFGERLRKKAQVRSPLPVSRNRRRHVWSDWRRLSRKAAQERKQKRKKAPVRQYRPERGRGDRQSSSATSGQGPP